MQPLGGAADAVVAAVVDGLVVVDPVHPGLEMGAGLVDGGEERLRVAGAVGPEQDARPDDLLGERYEGWFPRFRHVAHPGRLVRLKSGDPSARWVGMGLGYAGASICHKTGYGLGCEIINGAPGEVAEWLKAAVLKTAER